MKHESSLVYTIYDDGIWIECACGWSHLIGYSPTVEAVLVVWTTHLSEAEK